MPEIVAPEEVAVGFGAGVGGPNSLPTAAFAYRSLPCRSRSPENAPSANAVNSNPVARARPAARPPLRAAPRWLMRPVCLRRAAVGVYRYVFDSAQTPPWRKYIPPGAQLGAAGVRRACHFTGRWADTTAEGTRARGWHRPVPGSPSHWTAGRRSLRRPPASNAGRDGQPARSGDDVHQPARDNDHLCGGAAPQLPLHRFTGQRQRAQRSSVMSAGTVIRSRTFPFT